MLEKNIQWRQCNNASGRLCVRYASGLSWYEETMYDGRWITSGASTKGIAEEDPILYKSLENNSAFKLEIDGQSLHRGWEFVEAYEEKKSNGCVDVIVTLNSNIRPIRLYIHTLLTGTAIFSRWLEIENTGSNPAALGKLAVWSGRIFPTQSGDMEFQTFLEGFNSPHGPFEMGYIANKKPTNEGEFRWEPIDTREISFGSENGKSGWGHPIVYLRDKSAGELCVIQLGWSGNWSIKVKPDDYYSEEFTRRRRCEVLFASAEVMCPGPQRIIQAGEKISTPEVYFGRTSGGMNDLVQQLHDHHGICVIPAQPDGRENLITYNHAGYDIVANSCDGKMRREVEIAAELGADVFTVDAGWYGTDSEHWAFSVGDWYTGNRLPQGLEPIFDYARSKGLKCGLWVWIEAAHENSRLIKEHPDWLLERDGKQLSQLLDLAKPEVASWVESEIVRLVEKYELDLFRLDYNVSPGEGGYNRKDGFDENTIWRHYEALYGIFERIREKFPHLLLENCAGGGGRTDMGMLKRMHYTWLSDNQTLPHAVRLLNTALLTMPPHATAGFFGTCMNAHFAGHLQTHLRVNFMMGNPAILGVWPEHEDKNPLLRDEIKRYIEIFRKHIKPLVKNCDVYHHTISLPDNFATGWCVLEYAARDKSKSVVGIFRLGAEDESLHRVRPKGLLPGENYNVYRDNQQASFQCSGRELMSIGIAVELDEALTSELMIIEKCE